MRIWLMALVLLFATGCVAPVYYCETNFGQEPPLQNADGRYWPSNCFPQDQYNFTEPDPDGNPLY